MGSSERSNPRHYDPEGPLGLLRRKDDGTGPRRWLVGVVAGLVALAGAWWITTSPVFAARHVEVTGASHLTRADVLRVAGVGPGSNLFWFHAGSVERRLEHDRWIAAASVSRSLPGTLRIAIQERRAVAEVKTPRGFLVVAADGMVLAHRSVARRLPLLAPDPADPTSLRHLGPPASVAAAMNSWLRSRVVSVQQTPAGGIVVHLGSGIPVFYGDASQARQKGQALEAVLKWAFTGHRPLASIDVQAPVAPTARLSVYVPPVTVPVPSATGHASTGSKSGPGSPSPSPSPSPASSPKQSKRRSSTH